MPESSDATGRGRPARRAALRVGGAGLAAALAGRWLRPVAAQPEPPDQAPADLLFVQSFGRGALAPHPGALGAATLTLAAGVESTLFFADRPAREAGVVPTTDFLVMLTAAAAGDDPPNAALVLDTAEGAAAGAAGAIWVVTLLGGAYAVAAGTLTYAVRLIEPGAVAGRFAVTPATAPATELHFAAGHLFIDGITNRQGLHGHIYVTNRSGRQIPFVAPRH